MTALVCYFIFFVVVLLYVTLEDREYRHWRDAICFGGGVAYALGALALLFFPVALAAMSWSGEHARRTIDSLMLTPVGRPGIVWSRFWGLVFPVLRMYLYLVPFYIVISGGEFANEMSGSRGWQAFLVCVMSPKFVMIVMAMVDSDGWRLIAVVGILLKAMNDLGITLYSLGVAYYVSARIRSVGKSVALSYAIVVVSLWTVMAADTWVIFIGQNLNCGMDESFMVGGMVGCVLAMIRFILPFVLVLLVANRFDRYAMGRQARR
jgi:hypothetical protein